LNPIDETFARLKRSRRKAFIPFVTAGDPDLATTEAVVQGLAREGADLIEIGFPYSDPIADGPVIQASYTRALATGIRVNQVLKATGKWSKSQTPPLVAMISCSLVHHAHAEKFFAEAQACGFSGAILPDLPLEEADTLVASARAMDFKLIHLVTPTTSPERARKIIQLSSGFVYCVSVKGVTGGRSELPDELPDQLRRLRAESELPVCVGFGISTPGQAQRLCKFADGVIIGSALVKLLDAGPSRSSAAISKDVAELAHQFAEAIHDAKATD
jgi:tryptophan synthase alpha chain